MVKKGEFIDFASLKDTDDDYSTEFQVIIELAKKVKIFKKNIDYLHTKNVALKKVNKNLRYIKYNYDQRLKFLERFFNVFIDQLDAETRYAGFREKLIQEYSEFL